ncbi:MAG TPA: DUF3568 family protein [Planctomycetia bacterium]|nr:DUF3568 family protein [Planctomycetia bacterium]
MERLRLLALALATTTFGGCAGLFLGGGDPSSYAFSRGQGQIVFQLPLAVVVEEVDRSLTDSGFQVTFRHIDRQGAVVKAKSPDGKMAEATLKVEGMLTQLSLKVGRWGDREQTETLIASVKKGAYRMSGATPTPTETVTEAKSPRKPTPLKMGTPPTPRGEERKVQSVDEPPN